MVAPDGLRLKNFFFKPLLAASKSPRPPVLSPIAIRAPGANLSLSTYIALAGRDGAAA